MAGVVVSVRDRRTRFAAAWLGLAAAAYYAAFLCVILYNYDRDLLAICVVQAIFGGLAIDRRAPSRWPWLPGGHPDLVGPRDTFPVASILRDINPLIEVYERAP